MSQTLNHWMNIRGHNWGNSLAQTRTKPARSGFSWNRYNANGPTTEPLLTLDINSISFAENGSQHDQYVTISMNSPGTLHVTSLKVVDVPLKVIFLMPQWVCRLPFSLKWCPRVYFWQKGLCIMYDLWKCKTISRWRSMEAYIEHILTSVCNGSNPLERFRVRVGTGPEQLQQALPHENPDRCNWAGFTPKSPAFQHHNFRSN